MTKRDDAMTDNTTVHVRLNPDLDKQVAEKFERLARSTNRSSDELAAEAIAGFVEVNEWQIAGIEQGIAELDAGKGIPDDKVGAWLDSLGTDDELPPPTTDR